jgi:hypothetical protein
MAGERPTTSERATLDPFDALAGDVPPRDQRDLRERPFFSLAKAKRVTPILYQAGATQVQVYAVPEHGMATIWDADVLIWAASQILAAQDRGLPTSRFFRFTPYQLLIAIGRATGNREYHLLKGALTRLQSTVIRTTIRHGEHWRRQQFSWINEWEELTTRVGRCEGMEFVPPEWFYQGVLDRRLVLAIDPAYCSTASRASTPAVSGTAGGSSSGISTPRARVSRASPTSRSTSAGLSRANRCPAICSRSNAMMAASSSSCSLLYPQTPWISCVIRPPLSGLRAQPISGFRAHPYRDFGRTDCHQAVRRTTNPARLKTLNQTLNSLLLGSPRGLENPDGIRERTP